MGEENKGNIQPKVALIVPVYNDEDYLHVCLDSIRKQTTDFWEAWLIDDCSADSSAEIIREYCEADSRFHYLHNQVNSSAWVSRAKGIMAVSESVQYIMFADADDSLQPNAVARAYELMQKEPVDILHFGTNVENIANISQKRIQGYTAYLQPELARLQGREIFDSFVRRSFEGHLWNKMFKVELLQDVIRDLGVERVLPKAQDKVLYWAACWQWENLTYRGVADRLYNYNYGQGVEGGQNTLTLEQFKQYLAQAWTEDTIAEIMARHPEAAAEYAEVMENSRMNLMNHTARNFTRLSSIDKPAGLDLVAEYWQAPLDGARFASALAAHTWGSQLELSEATAEAGLFRTDKKAADMKVIGTYYHRLDNGGIQRVIAQLMPFWHALGYKIVVFTDFEPDDNDYDLPDYAERVIIGQSFSRSRRGRYARRGMAFAKLLQQYQVDCMVYHSYFSDVLLYDMLVCQSLNIPFVIYYHNVFSRFLRYNDTKFSTIPILAQKAEGLVCLDDTSAVWWRNFNKNVHVVLNPLTFDLPAVKPAARDNHNILFLCRLEEEAKHPNDAITIMRDLVKLMPDAKLYVVGSGEEKYVEGLNKRIAKLGLEENVIMVGFNKDVDQYYQQCSVFLSCSSHEGAPMTLCEATSFALPLVMYDLPYLAVAQENPGIFSVKQRDTDAAVQALYELLSNPNHLRAAGDAGRKYLADMYSADIGRQWQMLFASINSGKQMAWPSSRMMCYTLVRDYYDGTLPINNLRRDAKNNWRELQNVHNSLSFKVGRAITYIPRKMRDVIRKIVK